MTMIDGERVIGNLDNMRSQIHVMATKAAEVPDPETGKPSQVQRYLDGIEAGYSAAIDELQLRIDQVLGKNVVDMGVGREI